MFCQAFGSRDWNCQRLGSPPTATSSGMMEETAKEGDDGEVGEWGRVRWRSLHAPRGAPCPWHLDTTQRAPSDGCCIPFVATTTLPEHADSSRLKGFARCLPDRVQSYSPAVWEASPQPDAPSSSTPAGLAPCLETQTAALCTLCYVTLTVMRDWEVDGFKERRLPMVSHRAAESQDGDVEPEGRAGCVSEGIGRRTSPIAGKVEPG